MSDWSPEGAIAMERPHILAGEKMIARQEALVRELIERGREHLVCAADEVLGLLRESLELARERLRELEDRYGDTPRPNEE